MSVFADPRVRLAVLVAAAVLILDQASKAIVQRSMVLGETISLLPVFALSYVRNTGAAFGMFMISSARW